MGMTEVSGKNRTWPQGAGGFLGRVEAGDGVVFVEADGHALAVGPDDDALQVDQRGMIVGVAHPIHPDDEIQLDFGSDFQGLGCVEEGAAGADVPGQQFDGFLVPALPPDFDARQQLELEPFQCASFGVCHGAAFACN